MKYQQKSFTVPASAGTSATCARVGHTEADAKGRCLRCAALVRYRIMPSDGDTVVVANGWETDHQDANVLIRKAP